ncbi:MAG: hypothetical protein Kow0042_02580 [Calditrichia bacterium]
MSSFISKKLTPLVFLFIISNLLLAGTTGKIVGIVTDKNSGEPLIGVNIILEGTNLGASTDIDGTYIILNVPPGTYTVVAQYIGYSEVRMENVKVNIDLTTEVNFQLQETTLELGETVTVIAEREMVTKDLTASTAKVDAEQIQALPITEISEALELQAGYLDGHVRGGRKGEIAYWIDGVPVTDGYDRGQVVEVNKDVVEQLQFVSGAYNAEYGQAMSGIVNITTKEPREKFGGSITTYFGDFYSTHEFNREEPTHGPKDVFLNVNNFDPSRIRNFEGTLYGTIVPNKLSYFINARHIYFSGWLYGQRVFNPQNVAYEDSAGNFILHRDPEGKGDGEFVPMNWNRKIYLQGKVIYNLSPLVKIIYGFIRDDVEFEEYDRNYKLNPDGNLNKYRIGYTHLLKVTHTINNTTFYDLGFSYFDKTYKQYIDEAIFAENTYVHPKIAENQLPFSFKTGGTNNQYFYRNTKTALVKFDLSSQISKRHLIKTGIEFRRHSIFFDDITLRPLEGDNFNFERDDPYMTPEIFPIGTIYHDQYQHHPIELSAYIQDKMEFKDIIVNIGVRVDHFRPDGVILADPSDPDIYVPLKPSNRYHDVNGNGVQDEGDPLVTFAERQSYWYVKAKNKTQFSPRLGASFPISPTGIIHFSYGHFFQIPNFELLYRNPQFKLGSGTGNLGVIGNADLKPEQTISGEIGLQQQLGQNMAMDITMYFRDIRDLTGTRADEISIFGGSATYSKLVNSDFGFVKGFIISLRNRFTQGLNYTLDYTYQIAKGTASDPDQARNALAGGALPEVHLTPLGWDQRHTLNITLGYNKPNWGVTFIGNLGSGQPYTPRKTEDVSALRENSEKKPTTWNVDMRLYRSLFLFQRKLTLFLRVLNLFDHLNEVNVYDDTGRAGFTTDLERNKRLGTAQHVNTLEEWYTNMTHYSEPRRIEFGLMIDF